MGGVEDTSMCVKSSSARGDLLYGKPAGVLYAEQPRVCGQRARWAGAGVLKPPPGTHAGQAVFWQEGGVRQVSFGVVLG